MKIQNFLNKAVEASRDAKPASTEAEKPGATNVEQSNVAVDQSTSAPPTSEELAQVTPAETGDTGLADENALRQLMGPPATTEGDDYYSPDDSGFVGPIDGLNTQGDLPDVLPKPKPPGPDFDPAQPGVPGLPDMSQIPGMPDFPGFPGAPGAPTPDGSTDPVTSEGGAVQRPHEEGNRNIYVIDNFEEDSIDVDGDGTKDLTHGELVSELIEAEDENANVHRVHSESNAEGNTAAIKDVTERKRNGEDVDAVNLSQGVGINIEEVGQEIGVDLTQENLGEHKEEVMEYLKNSPDPEHRAAYDTILALEELAAEGVDVYVAGGNGGPGNANAYTLADGVKGVGANDELPDGASVQHEGMPEDYEDNDWYSADNDLIDVEDQGFYTFTRVEGGYDINGDGVADLEGTFSAGDSIEMGQRTNGVYGTSFAAPAAAAHGL